MIYDQLTTNLRPLMEIYVEIHNPRSKGSLEIQAYEGIWRYAE